MAYYSIKKADLKLEKLIGEGGYSAVFQAIWNGYHVAAKRLNKPDQHEVKVLSKLAHPNIVKLIGVCDDPDNLTQYLVLELCSGGSLRSYLDQQRSQKKRLPTRLVYDWAKQAAKPIQYLNEMKIVHKDVKSPSYLIADGNILKLADFGLAKNIESTIKNATDRASHPWMAPELVEGILSPTYDIHAYGVVVWELCTSEFPFEGSEPHHVIWRVCHDEERPVIPPDCPKPLADLMRQCWEKDRQKRPTIDHILMLLTSAEKMFNFTNRSGMLGQNEPVANLHLVDTKLLQDCLQAAILRIGDSGEGSRRTTERITLMQTILQPGVGQGPLNFLNTIKKRVTALIGEWEERGGSRVRWLNNEGVAVAKVQEGGTFRQPICQHPVYTVTPLLAEILAFCDYNDNLSILEIYPQGHWQHQLWLAILNDPTLSPLHYVDFLSPKNQVLREKALVKMMGTGERRFTATLSFSWLLKNYLEMAHSTARELKANTEQSAVHETFCSQINESKWGRLLNQIIPHGARQDFMKAYMMDYVSMVYAAKSDAEVECVCQALSNTSKIMMRQSSQGSTLIESLVGLHMAYAKIQGCLLHFSRLVEVHPDLVNTKNLHTLTDQNEEMTLDAKAVHVIINSLQPTTAECAKQEYQHLWIGKVQTARPVLDTVIQAILHDRTDQYGPAAKQVVANAKQMWDRMTLLRLFIENLCSTNAGVEDKIAQQGAGQGALLWRGMHNVTSMKNIDSLNHLEKILTLLNKTASKLHFRSRAFHSFRQSCNAFFMDVVCQLCFADGTAPSQEVVVKLLSYVTRKKESDEEAALQTKMLTSFAGDCIDRTPVIRSTLLQLILLQGSFGEVHAYVDQYLMASQQILVNSVAQDILEVCMMFINCTEDALYHKASSQTNATLGQLNSATQAFRESSAWMQRRDPREGVTVQYLQAIARARFGMVVTAQLLHEGCERSGQYEKGTELELDPQIRNLFKEARAFCNDDSNHQAHLFLIRQLCNCYGTNTMETLSQFPQFRWVKPRELRTDVTQGLDRFVICGAAYRDIREALAQFIVTKQFNGVTAAVRGCKEPPNQLETILLLALYREFTLSHCAIGDQEVSLQQLANCLVYNRLGNQLSSTPGQNQLQQTLSAFVVHTIIALNRAPDHHLLGPLQNLLSNPAQLRASFFPTMPEDYRMEAKAVLAHKEVVHWFECPNGHLYVIGTCGAPVMVGRCPECGVVIGGRNNQLAEGQRRITASMRDTTRSGHVIGDAASRGARAVPERYLSSISISIMRALLHATMIGATLKNHNEVQHLITPAPGPDPVTFLMHHLQTDLNHLAAACGKSQDDCVFIIHMVLHRITTSQNQAGSCGTTWPNKKCRQEWEMQFNQAFINPVLKNLNQKLVTANETLRTDERFSTNPLLRLLHQPVAPVTQEADLNQLHSLSSIWQHRQRISVESLQQYLTQSLQQAGQGQQQERPLALLEAFLEQESILRLLFHLPDIIRLQQMLIDKYHRYIEAEEATSMTIKESLDKVPQGQYLNQIQPLIRIFIDTWNQVREHIPNYGGLKVPREHCMEIMTESSSLAMILPTRREAGVCSTALVDFLLGAHNGFVQTYRRLENIESEATVINPCDASIGHLVAYHHERDLLPMILFHCDYTMEAGSKGTGLTYNLLGLQRQIKERFVQGRPKLAQKIAHLVFREDSRDATVFQALRTKVEQESLSQAIKKQILSELKSFQDLCDCLAAVDIAIGFLVNTEVEGSTHIREYLHRMLKLPTERGLRPSPKAQQFCRLHHILSLWQALAVERARRLLHNKKDPFQRVGQDFSDQLNPEQKHELEQALRHINVEYLVAELYEYIELGLKEHSNREQDISGWSISHVLSAYIDGKDGQPVHEMEEHMPDELVLRHALDVWKHAVKYMQKQQAKASAHHH